ncbi:MAG: hypothetical protein JW736_07110 [Deltaproteobacteria bacterium]|nr:hypothetical protein [Deltaproteobacteria bacterium]MBN2688431.1 hypothetical protein [Deltaproteobacteria bacterium]
MDAKIAYDMDETNVLIAAALEARHRASLAAAMIAASRSASNTLGTN